MLERPPKQTKCVLCGKPQDLAFKPFCSKRCANLDLSRWFKGSYAIPSCPEDESGNPAPPVEIPLDED